MARRRKAFLARRKAALKGWRTRRKNERKRSEAAKRGWKTRLENARKKKSLRIPLRERLRPEAEEKEEIIRRTYQKKGKRPIAVEVRKRGERIIEVRIGKKTFTRKSDIARTLPLFEAAT
jgi:hypothetical protein